MGPQRTERPLLEGPRVSHALIRFPELLGCSLADSGFLPGASGILSEVAWAGAPVLLPSDPLPSVCSAPAHLCSAPLRVGLVKLLPAPGAWGFGHSLSSHVS